MADEFTPLPDEQGYEYGSILPVATRPIPYANALQPQLAVPGMIRNPVNALAGMLQIPGEALRGQLGQSPEQLMPAANRFVEGMQAAGLGPEESEFARLASAAKGAGHTLEAVEHDPFAGQDMFASTAVSSSPSKMNLDLNSGMAHQSEVQDIDNAVTARVLKQQAYDRVPMLQNRRLTSPSAANLDVVSGGAHQQMMDSFQAEALRMEDKEFEDRIAHYRAQREVYKQGQKDAASTAATKFVKEGGT